MRISLSFLGLVASVSLTVGCSFALPAREIPIDCEGALRHQDYDTYCQPGSVSAAPSAVTNLVAMPSSDMSVKLTWTPGKGQTSYRIDIALAATPDQFTTVGSEAADATASVVASLMPNTSYVFSVIALNSNGSSAATTVTASTSATLPMAPGATSASPMFLPRASDGKPYLCFPKANNSGNGDSVDYKTLSAVTPPSQQMITSTCSSIIPTSDVVIYLPGNFMGSEDINEFANADATGTVVTLPNAVANKWYAPAATSHLAKTVISQSTVFWVMTWHAATQTITLAQAPNGQNGGQPIKGSGVIR